MGNVASSDPAGARGADNSRWAAFAGSYSAQISATGLYHQWWGKPPSTFAVAYNAKQDTLMIFNLRTSSSDSRVYSIIVDGTARLQRLALTAPISTDQWATTNWRMDTPVPLMEAHERPAAQTTANRAAYSVTSDFLNPWGAKLTLTADKDSAMFRHLQATIETSTQGKRVIRIAFTATTSTGDGTLTISLVAN
jgi:hypothetical protein